MRKVLAAIMAIVMVLSGYMVMAETVEVEESVLSADQFTFRNNVSWESTIEDVQKAEITEPAEININDRKGWQQLWYEGISVSNYTASLTYTFLPEQLVCVFYGFDSVSNSDCLYLAGALSSKYGEPISNDVEYLRMLMNLIESDDYEIVLHQNWKLSDNTYIAAVSMDDMFYIMYFNEAKLLSLSGTYNTTGL